jgi:hypothetical protein
VVGNGREVLQPLKRGDGKRCKGNNVEDLRVMGASKEREGHGWCLHSPVYLAQAQLEGRYSGADQPDTSIKWVKLAQDEGMWLPHMGTWELGPADDPGSTDGCGHSHLSTKMGPTSCLPRRAGGGACVLGVSLEADRLAMPQNQSQHCSGAKVAMREGGLNKLPVATALKHPMILHSVLPVTKLPPLTQYRSYLVLKRPGAQLDLAGHLRSLRSKGLKQGATLLWT